MESGGRGTASGLSAGYQASVIAALGATGSGKSSFVKERLQRARRALIWDALQEYNAGVICWDLADLVRQVDLTRKAGFHIIFRPSSSRKHRTQQFDQFCKIARAVGNLTMVVEELRLVTTPQSAPDQWAQCTLTGRHYGLEVIGTSQRPASIDKDFFGNCTLIRTGILPYHRDRENVAYAIGADEAQIAALGPMQYLEWDRVTRLVRSGVQKYLP